LMGWMFRKWCSGNSLQGYFLRSKSQNPNPKFQGIEGKKAILPFVDEVTTEFGIWNLEFGVWSLEFYNQEVAI